LRGRGFQSLNDSQNKVQKRRKEKKMKIGMKKKHNDQTATRAALLEDIQNRNSLHN
jgi:hypothetical protein